MRSIRNVYKAAYQPIQDLITYSPFPTRELQQVDPFIFLNHHGFQTYPANNNGLPFGPHPHRGMETVTFIIDGDIAHMDSSGSNSVIKSGGVQWMTAGSGLIHAEVSSDEFKKNGGDLEILQLWLNLPAKLKMTPPAYTGLQKDEIPEIKVNEKVQLQLVSGEYNDSRGAFNSLTHTFLSILKMAKGGVFQYEVPIENNILCYVIRGKVTINQTDVPKRHLAVFEGDDQQIEIKAKEDSLLLFGHAKPLNEPMVARGPFVMNTEAEISQAYQDFQEGKMGKW